MLQKSTYSRLRQSHVLGHYDPRLRLFTVLLRVEGAELADSRARLEGLGFEPEQSDRKNAISWKCAVTPEDLPLRAAQLCSALSNQVLLDIGSACLDALGRIHTHIEEVAARNYWPGQFLVYAQRDRCVVFDREVHPAEIERSLLEEGRDYFAREFAPPTE